MDDESSKPSDDTTTSIVTKRQSRPNPTTCKICQAPALYSYFGAIVCHSCRKFFRRNAHKQLSDLKCLHDGHCEVHITNPRMCLYCRLGKCFANGMQLEMIRASRSTTKTRREKVLDRIIASIHAKLKETDQTEPFPTLNLLRSDQSTLTLDQWNRLSNLTHCYDESSGLAFTRSFLEEQYQLPPKMRFKLTTVREYFTTITNTCPFLYEKNNDFVSLCRHDRSLLLHNTMKYVAGLCGYFITRHSRLLEIPTFCRSAELVYGSDSMVYNTRLINEIDFDSTFFKLILVMLPFSTYNYTYYSNIPSVNLRNIEAVLRTQNMYSELVWRYLVYNYGHDRAVIWFSNLLRYLLVLNDAVIKALESKPYADIIDSLIKQTEQNLSTNE